MSLLKLKCTRCGKRLLTYYQYGFQRYRSPVKRCKSCGNPYADPRCHEIAAEGIPEDAFRTGSYVVMLVIGLLILYRGIHLAGRRQLGVVDEMQWLLPSVFIIGGLVMSVGGIIEVIWIKTGGKARRYDRLWRESERRLKDKEYAWLLKESGYPVPEKYL